MGTEFFWFYDLIVVAVVLVCIYAGGKKGFMRMVISMIGYLASIVISIIAANAIASWLYTSYIGPSITSGIEQRVGTLAAEYKAEDVIAAATASFPQVIADAMKQLVGENSAALDKIAGSVGSAAGEVADSAAQAVVEPMLTFFVKVVIFMVLMSILSFIVIRVAKLFEGVGIIPIIGPINSLLGCVLGVLQAGMILLLIVLLLRAIILISGGQLIVLNEPTIERTFAFRYVYGYDILSLFS